MTVRKKGFVATIAISSLSILATALVTMSPANAASAACAKVGAGYPTIKGGYVEVYSSVIQPEAQHYIDATKDFKACTGITIAINGTNTFESTLPIRVKGGNTPDIAMLPQPALLAQMVATGKAVPAPAGTLANVNKYWAPSWKAYGTVNGKFYAAPNSANMKSIVWYSPKQFAKNGYTVPTTWDAMNALADKMVANNQTPWCGGLGSGTATGWPATDWVEEVVLRTYGSAVYNQWWQHKIAFNDPRIVSAMNTVAKWLQNPKYVGDPKAIATRTFQDAGQAIPAGNGCMMLQQASFYATQFPTGTNVSPTGDAWAFYLPGINPSVTTPVEGGGEFFLAFNSKPATVAVQNFLSSPQWAEELISTYGKNGGWTTANSGVPLSAYKAPFDQFVAKYLGDKKSTFVFDASDLMPAAVGAGTEWTGFTNWFAGTQTTQQTADSIEASWPKS
jgi:alpha-glucoside transport system substrate-binding protein